MDTLAAAVTTLTNVITQLGTSISGLVTATSNTNQTLNQFVTTPAQTTATTTSSFKPEPPAIYQGDPNRVMAFIEELEVYFTLANITTVEQKTFFALTKIRGGTHDHATLWADVARTNIISRKKEITRITDLNASITQDNAQPNATQTALHTVPDPFFKTWDDFVEKFAKQFGLFNTQEEAVESIKLLEQGNMTCEEYLNIFHVHQLRSGYNEIAALQEFKRGLNKGLRNKLETTFPLPTNNADGTINIGNWVQRALDLDLQFRRSNKVIQNAGKGNLTQGQTSNNRIRTNPPVYGNKSYGNYRTYANTDKAPAKEMAPTIPTWQKDPNAMEIDRNGRSRGDITCYHCQGKGHMARECPNINKPKVFPARGTRIRALYNEMTEEEREQLKEDMGF